MALPLQKYREIVFLLLYSREFPTSDVEETIFMIMGELKVTKKWVLDAREKAVAIEAKLPLLDEEIASTSTEYHFDRISRVEKTLLRLAVYEMLHEPETPQLVAIAEAIRLTRKFGTPESAQFVNAILDLVYKKHGALTSNQSLSV